ncbi:MAG: divergent polysaccharide deacetylase family protein [Pseudomonadota bacterium]|nr:divergent polysaccharide deacetylase family protein [Pseudomonadota bacterium]
MTGTSRPNPQTPFSIHPLGKQSVAVHANDLRIVTSSIKRSIFLLFSLSVAIIFFFHWLNTEVWAKNNKLEYSDTDIHVSQLSQTHIPTIITVPNKNEGAIRRSEKTIKRFSSSIIFQQTLVTGPLMLAPNAGLIQNIDFGKQPRISSDGRQPFQVYGKPFDPADKRRRIGIVVNGLGLSDAATETAIQGLPGAVTLAFAPYSKRLIEWIRFARAAGHEVLINVPMERLDYPNYTPGPYALMTTLNSQKNIERLLWNLGRATGYVGVVDYYGSRFTSSHGHMKPILREIKRRGLLYLDSGISPQSTALSISRQLKIPVAQATLTLDEVISRRNIDIKFFELERHARKNGNAIGMASPYPVSLERIAAWAPRLEARGYAIAPITAIAQIGK